jgi:hypothetical protein
MTRACPRLFPIPASDAGPEIDGKGIDSFLKKRIFLNLISANRRGQRERASFPEASPDC